MSEINQNVEEQENTGGEENTNNEELVGDSSEPHGILDSVTIAGQTYDIRDTKVVADTIAPIYDSTLTYILNSYCTYNGMCYRCIYPIATPEEWDSSHWSRVYALNEVVNKANASGTILSTYLSRGRKANTTIGEASLAFGVDATASGPASASLGYYNYATSFASVAIGVNTRAEGAYALAFGRGAIATGYYSYAGGSYNFDDIEWDYLPEWVAGTHYDVGDEIRYHYAYGWRGLSCVVANDDETWVGGHWQYITKSKFIEIIGNGDSSNNRSNARAMDWDGNLFLRGDVYVECTRDSKNGLPLLTPESLCRKVTSNYLWGTVHEGDILYCRNCTDVDDGYYKATQDMASWNPDYASFLCTDELLNKVFDDVKYLKDSYDQQKRLFFTHEYSNEPYSLAHLLNEDRYSAYVTGGNSFSTALGLSGNVHGYCTRFGEYGETGAYIGFTFVDDLGSISTGKITNIDSLTGISITKKVFNINQYNPCPANADTLLKIVEYKFSYTVAANEQKSITIADKTSGTNPSSDYQPVALLSYNAGIGSGNYDVDIYAIFAYNVASTSADTTVARVYGIKAQSNRTLTMRVLFARKAFI